jgi:protein involved in polysaccharide export with SLBB domain
VAALVCLGLLALAGRASAQPVQQGPVFKYYVWGQVRTPGSYSLGGNPDIVELLSAAGGPTQYADVQHVVLVRASAQKHIRVNLKRMLAAGQVVPLSPGDVVMVPDSPWYTMRYVLDVATTVASFGTLAMTILIFAGVGK